MPGLALCQSFDSGSSLSGLLDVYVPSINPRGASAAWMPQPEMPPVDSIVALREMRLRSDRAEGLSSPVFRTENSIVEPMHLSRAVMPMLVPAFGQESRNHARATVASGGALAVSAGGVDRDAAALRPMVGASVGTGPRFLYRRAND